MGYVYIAPFNIRLDQASHFHVNKSQLYVGMRSGVELIIAPQYRETAWQLEAKLLEALRAID